MSQPPACDVDWTVRLHCVPRYMWALVWLALIPLVLVYDCYLYELYGRLLGHRVPLEWVAQFLTEAIELKWIALGSVILALLVPRLRWWFLVDVALIMPAQALVVDALKRLFGRIRPEPALHCAIFQGPNLDQSGCCFPSGHAAAGFALAGLLSVWYPRWRWAFVIGAIAVALSRLQLERHFPSDVLFGGFVGWYIGWGVATWRRRLRKGSVPGRIGG